MKCGIIGYPLNKPKSVIIWEKFFKKNNIKSKMNAYSIQTNLFKKFILNMLNDKQAYAFSITMPYKKKVLKLCSNLDMSAKLAKSANLIVKNNNQFIGYNTDVLGANETIKKYLTKYNNIIIIGLGGVGTSLYNFLKSKYPDIKFHLITSQKKKIRKIDKIYLNLNRKILSSKSILINCTPLGSSLNGEYLNKSPIKKIDFKYINKQNLIFDVVYKPSKTLLRKYADQFSVQYINGTKMVNYQAKEALRISFAKS